MKRLLRTVALALILTPAFASAQTADFDPWAGYEPRNMTTLRGEAEARQARLKELAQADLIARNREDAPALGVYATPLRPVPTAEEIETREDPLTAKIRPLSRPVADLPTLIEVSPRPKARPLSSWKGAGLVSDFEARALMAFEPLLPEVEVPFTGVEFPAAVNVPFPELPILTSRRPKARPIPSWDGVGLASTTEARMTEIAAHAHLPFGGRRPSGVRYESVDGFLVAPQTLRAFVDVSRQRMTLMDGNEVIAEWPVSTGRPGYESTRGEFQVTFLSRNHRSSQYNNAPMPCSVFYHNGEAFHGTNAISQLGSKASHGCVRLATQNACALYDMVQERGKESLTVSVFD